MHTPQRICLRGIIINHERNVLMKILFSYRFLYMAAILLHSMIFCSAQDTRKDSVVLSDTGRTVYLEGVDVRGKKPVISFEGEKMIVNVERLEGTASLNMFEILRLVPGVVILNDQTIRLNGMGDITVLLNGRKQTMTADQAVRLLKSMPASNISEIEVYNGKSVRFDAAGSGGTLNIVTKANVADRYNIAFTNTLYIDREAATAHNIFANLKQGRVQSSFSASLSNRLRVSESATASRYAGAEPVAVSDTYYNHSRTSAPSLYGSVEVALSEKETVGIVASSYFDNNRRQAEKSSRVVSAAPHSILLKQEGMVRENLTSADLIYSRKIDTFKSKLTIDAGLITGYSRDNPEFTNRYFDAGGEEWRPPVRMRARIPMEGYQLLGKADLEKYFANKNAFIAGVKMTSTQITHYVRYDTLMQHLEKQDLLRTDSLAYREQIAAAYASYRHRFGKFSVQAGLRMEMTVMKTESLTGDSIFSRTYFNVFPNVSIAWNDKKIRQSFSFSTSINRPVYQQMNPYVQYLDDFRYQVGNAALRPGYSFNFNGNTAWDNTVYFSAGYTFGKNAVTPVARLEPDSLLTVIRPYNAMNYHVGYANLSGSYQFFRIWEGNLNLSGNLVKYAVLPEYKTSLRDDEPVASMNLSNSNSLQLTKTLMLEESFTFYSGRRYYQNSIRPRWQLNAGLRYKSADGKLSVSAGVSDIFRTMRSEGQTFYNDYTADYESWYNSRRLNVSVTINLGKLKKDFSKTGASGKESERFKSNP